MRYSPHNPIFDKGINYGMVQFGHQLGEFPESVSVPTVTRPVSVPAPSLSAEQIYFGDWAYSGTGGSPTSTLYWPFAPASGDVAVLYSSRSNFDSFQAITDFTLVHQGPRGAIYTRLCDGTEDLSGYSVDLAGSFGGRHASIIIVVKGLSGLTEVGFATQSPAVSAPTDITYPSITPTSQPSLIFYSGHGLLSGSPAVNPGGSNPTPVLLTETSDSNPPNTTQIIHCAIWVGRCTSTSALGARTVAETGWSNFYHGMTFGISAV